MSTLSSSNILTTSLLLLQFEFPASLPEEDRAVERRKFLEGDVEMLDDWKDFLEDQTEFEFELWMLEELWELGVDWNKVKKDLMDRDTEIEEEEVLESIPETPRLSRKLRALELEEEECICITDL